MTKRGSSRCPDPEVLAAFVAGTLSGAELEATIEHLRDCEDCRNVVTAAARWDREEEPPAAAPPATVRPLPQQAPATIPWWLKVAAAALAGIAILSGWLAWSRWSNEPIRVLAAAVPRDGRFLEPRLSGGFPWAPLKPVERSGEPTRNPAQMKLIGVAGDVIEKTADDPSADAQHAAAVASLLAGDPKEAVARLAHVVTPASEPSLWSDLAAARYTAAVHAGDSQQLAQALAAADAALKADPRHAEALFNRSLILERLGLRQQAREAWKRFLEVDSDSPWAAEAQKHLQALDDTVEFRDELERNYVMIAADAAVARAVVQRFPQWTRVWGESEILSRWARAEMSGDGEAARQHLQVARFFGEQLAERGEGLLRAAVRTIDRADAANRKTLAAAHIEFREAQRTHKSGKPVEAERPFRAAAAAFERAGSPMALLARYFAANTTFDQGRIEEARVQLEQLERTSPPEYAAHAAQVKWQLGLAYASLGRWGQSMRAFGDSISLFELLGEKNYAMAVREILAEAYDRIGEPREAWRHRLVALQELGRSDDRRLRVAVHAIARGAALNHDWPVSLSFLNLQTEMARRDGDELMYVNTLLTRAVVAKRAGDLAGARNDLGRAIAAMAEVEDPALHDRAEAERLAVEAFLASSPAQSIPLLDKAIEFQRARGRRMFLPELLLQRGRAHLAGGALDRAAGDFEAGIRELETQGLSIEAANNRWGIFAAAEDLFDEAVALALRNNDGSAAFAYLERARAREVLDDMGPNGMPPTRLSAENAVAVEYLVLPRKLVIFIVDAAGVRTVESDVSEVVIADDVIRLSRAAVSGPGAEFTRIATRMFDRLLGPVADELASGRTLIVVPDDELSLVPFAALIDTSGRHVIERRAVVVTPSVTAFTHLSSLSHRIDKDSRLLVVAGPSSRDGEIARLTAAECEADAVAAHYESSSVFVARDDDPHALEQKAARADVIHFVGHAIPPDSSTAAALVTSRREELDAQLEAREIAAMRLPRTSIVVLAACGTARGHARPGEASVSLARAFLTAGVSSVAATLWPIEDGQAAEFFPRLHHYLARGLPPAEALRAAQLEWVHRGHTPPALWAAVQIIGS